MNRFILSLTVALCLFTAQVQATELRLWFYFPTNLLVDANVDKGIELLNRAAKAGYNGVLLTDSKFTRWGQLPDRYEKNVKRFRDECRRLNIECFVAVCPVGYSNDILNLDPNFAEGMPVVETPFLVKNGMLIPEQPAEPILKNGGFEQSQNNRPAGWGFVDEPGKISVLDTEIKAEGNVSLRMQEPENTNPHNRRAMQTITVKPFHYYHVSFMIKTENFEPHAETRVTILAPDGQSLNWHMPPLKSTEDWRRIDLTFNSLDNTSLNVYFGTWGAQKGKIWWDDIKIEPAGFVNILRRAGTPISIKSEDGKTIFTEGKDFDKIVDPKMGTIPYAGSYTAWHDQPVIRIPSGSRLVEGQKVLVSYYHMSIIYGEQVGACFADPKFKEMLRWQIEQVHKNVEPDGYFLSHDEIRQGGWDKSCLDTGKTPGEMLAENVAWCVQTIKEVDPGKPIAAWSDMFDPTHNAQKEGKYYLVKGDAPWYSSWEKLPKDVIIGNWNSNPKIRKESLKHFADRGNPQILAGYYDAKTAEETAEVIRRWMRDANEFQGLIGAIYTTWENRYEFLEVFAESAKAEWKP
jgi:hypothetical protein